MNAWSYTEAGGHPQNEDSVAVTHHPEDATAILCFVADGQGGQPGGSLASELACRTAVEIAKRIPATGISHRRSWVELLNDVDESVRADENAGYTTFVGLAACSCR